MSDFFCSIIGDKKKTTTNDQYEACSYCILGFGFGGSPCATVLVKELDCVSVLLEPPRGVLLSPFLVPRETPRHTGPF